jgi:hypothetical protein
MKSANLQRALQPRRLGQFGLSRIESQKRLRPPMQGRRHMQDVHGTVETFKGVLFAQPSGQGKHLREINFPAEPKTRADVQIERLTNSQGEVLGKPFAPVCGKQPWLELERVFELKNYQWRQRVLGRKNLDHSLCLDRCALISVKGEEEGCLRKILHLQSPCRSSRVPSYSASLIAFTSSFDKVRHFQYFFRRAAKSGLFGGSSGLSGTIFAKGFPRRVTRTSSPAASHAAILGK